MLKRCLKRHSGFSVMRNTLSRSESLKSYKLIRLLFSEGESFFSYPFKVLYIEQEKENNIPVQFLISVSKKRIKTAVARNHIKRLFRESYRQKKHPLFKLMLSKNKQLLLAFIFVGDESANYQQMEEKTEKAMGLLIQKL